MMSPLSVSAFLPSNLRFDVVIFDEASQVRPADAINCIYRGKQLILAGDQKQLPPTSFFELGLDAEDDSEEEQFAEFESILDLCKSSFRSISLRWHYRSQHEDLITFSNYSFYEGKLLTFPNAITRSDDLGIEMFLVNGVYRRGGQRDNPIEAEKVLERVLYHTTNHPDRSIGVVAFSEAQASAIELVWDAWRQRHPQLPDLSGEDRLRGAFVKNLETVQGDERDIIIFSIGYGRDEGGRFTLNLGPLTATGGARRLNVAITRARRKVEIITSVRAADFREGAASEGVRHLKKYLAYAEAQDRRASVLGLELGPNERGVESPFEEEVAHVLLGWGFDVVPQVGCAEYRIDLGVRHPSRRGDFAIGIECDGAMYHSSRVARDRDRLRAEVLQRLGWRRLYRIWGPSWYRNRKREEALLKDAVEEAIRSMPPVDTPRLTDIPVEELAAETAGTPVPAPTQNSTTVVVQTKHAAEQNEVPMPNSILAAKNGKGQTETPRSTTQHTQPALAAKPAAVIPTSRGSNSLSFESIKASVWVALAGWARAQARCDSRQRKLLDRCARMASTRDSHLSDSEQTWAMKLLIWAQRIGFVLPADGEVDGRTRGEQSLLFPGEGH